MKSPSQKDILKLLLEIRQAMWIGNYEERLKAINARIDKTEGDKELHDKKFLAVEKYLGIKFEEGYEYKITKKYEKNKNHSFR